MADPVLAQINIARARYALGAPEMASFFERVAAVNAVGDRAPGCVWRLAEEMAGDTAVEVFADPRLVTNMTMWRSLCALEDFIHRTVHAKVMARRAEWFAPLDGPHLAMWWHDPAKPPTLALGKAKLDRLARLGPTPEAFAFNDLYDADGRPVGEPHAASRAAVEAGAHPASP